jgi:hypothetical protein
VRKGNKLENLSSRKGAAVSLIIIIGINSIRMSLSIVLVIKNSGTYPFRLIANSSITVNNVTVVTLLTVDSGCIIGDLYLRLSDIQQLGLSIDSADQTQVTIADANVVNVFIFGDISVSLYMDDGSVKTAVMRPRVLNVTANVQKLLCYEGLRKLLVTQDFVKHTLISYVERV